MRGTPIENQRFIFSMRANSFPKRKPVYRVEIIKKDASVMEASFFFRADMRSAFQFGLYFFNSRAKDFIYFYLIFYSPTRM